MLTKKHISILLFLFCQLAFCQDQKIVHGKIIAKNASTGGIKIVNLANESETYSNEKGEFHIVAKADDLLVFSSINFEPLRTLIEKKQFESDLITFEMIPKIIQLDEVKIITYPELDAVKLGILTKPAKKYTKAERRLFTAQSTPVDLILNAISGRTKMLKNDIKTEGKATDLSILSELFEDDYYINELKIDPKLIKAFQYYAIEDPNLSASLRVKPKNKALISFILYQLAFNYNLLQQKEH